MKRIGVALLVLAACKGKTQEKKTEPPAPAAAAADAAAVAVADAAPVTPPPPPPAPMPSETMVAGVPDGPRRSGDGSRVVWCTRGGNGMAEWNEVNCHVAAPGKKTTVIPVMTYADAMAVDEGADPAVDPDAGVKAASARERVEAGLAKLATESAGLTPMAAPFACSFQDGEFVRREDDPLGTYDGCSARGVTAHITAPGKVTLTSGDKPLFAEVFKPRPRGKGDGGVDCSLEASMIDVTVDEATKTVALAVRLSNPSDACALVTEFEVRAVKLR